MALRVGLDTGLQISLQVDAGTKVAGPGSKASDRASARQIWQSVCLPKSFNIVHTNYVCNVKPGLPSCQTLCQP